MFLKKQLHLKFNQKSFAHTTKVAASSFMKIEQGGRVKWTHTGLDKMQHQNERGIQVRGRYVRIVWFRPLLPEKGGVTSAQI